VPVLCSAVQAQLLCVRRRGQGRAGLVRRPVVVDRHCCLFASLRIYYSFCVPGLALSYFFLSARVDIAAC
jgi:hypothetical protein